MNCSSQRVALHIYIFVPSVSVDSNLFIFSPSISLSAFTPLCINMCAFDISSQFLQCNPVLDVSKPRLENRRRRCRLLIIIMITNCKNKTPGIILSIRDNRHDRDCFESIIYRRTNQVLYVDAGSNLTHAFENAIRFRIKFKMLLSGQLITAIPPQIINRILARRLLIHLFIYVASRSGQPART